MILVAIVTVRGEHLPQKTFRKQTKMIVPMRQVDELPGNDAGDIFGMVITWPLEKVVGYQ